MIFKKLLEEDVTLDLVTKGKRSALSKIAAKIARRSGLDDRVVLRRLWKRERSGPTSIGRGVAVPHALCGSISCPVASFTRLAPAIDFGSFDGEPVDLVFTLLWPRSAVATFLPALAQLCRLVRAPRNRDGLRIARSYDEVMAILDSDPRATNEHPTMEPSHSPGSAQVNEKGYAEMKNQIEDREMPSIVVGKTDHERLNNIAFAAADRFPEISDGLLLELERARVVPDVSVPGNIVSMGSTVEYETDTGARRVTLVFPRDADISEGKISILTPVGTALLGLAAGQTMHWTARDDRQHSLRVLAVSRM